MNLHQRPELLDRLAAEYALGTLRGHARHRLDTLAIGNDAVRQAIHSWQRRLDTMAELGRAVEPPDSVWLAIEGRLGLASETHGRFESTPPRPVAPHHTGEHWWDTLGFWRGISGIALAVAIISIAIALHTAGPTLPGTAAGEQRVGYVSVLHDGQSNSTLLVTWDDAHSMVTLRRLSDTAVPAGSDLQLWGIPSGGAPVSLGVLPKKGPAAFKVAHRPQNYGVLAVSVEPPGGSQNPNGPTGPVIYTGKLLQAS
jgi:anti-sigma-K factor RskA